MSEPEGGPGRNDRLSQVERAFRGLSKMASFSSLRQSAVDSGPAEADKPGGDSNPGRNHDPATPKTGIGRRPDGAGSVARSIRSVRSVGNISLAGSIGGDGSMAGPLSPGLADWSVGQPDGWRVAGWQASSDGDSDPTTTSHTMVLEDGKFAAAFRREFDPVQPDDADAGTDAGVSAWKAKLKHYIILSAAGKIVWSRHGDDGVVFGTAGILQSIMSMHADDQAGSSFRGFSVGTAVRVATLSKGGLILLAISRLGESDSQMRAQIESLYMQILSTLTRVGMVGILAHRPWADLRQPIHGTESMLAALADGFTRGSPSSLLGALECLKLRLTHRRRVDQSFLASRTIPEPDERPAWMAASFKKTVGLVLPPSSGRAAPVLYGLIVAGGKLVSVIRPREHSLHPNDLRLLFNVLFESGNVKPDEGSSLWAPVCLPGFNDTGYVHMYASFVDSRPEQGRVSESATQTDHTITIILITTDKQALEQMREMESRLLVRLRSPDGGLSHIAAALAAGRPACGDLVPNTVISHFLYKSKTHVQFVAPSLDPVFDDAVERRRLFTVYGHLHSIVHAKPFSPRICHTTSPRYIALAWTTSKFEFYAVAIRQPARSSDSSATGSAPLTVNRAVLSDAASKMVEVLRREEPRLFLGGEAVFSIE